MLEISHVYTERAILLQLIEEHFHIRLLQIYAPTCGKKYCDEVEKHPA